MSEPRRKVGKSLVVVGVVLAGVTAGSTALLMRRPGADAGVSGAAPVDAWLPGPQTQLIKRPDETGKPKHGFRLRNRQ